MEPLSKIRSELRSYIDGKIDYLSFRGWMSGVYADHAAEYASEPESEALRLCRAIEWELADFSEEMISEELLKQGLSGLCDVSDQSKTLIPPMASVTVRMLGRAPLFVGNSGGSPLSLQSPSGSFVQQVAVGHPLVEQHS